MIYELYIHKQIGDQSYFFFVEETNFFEDLFVLSSDYEQNKGRYIIIDHTFEYPINSQELHLKKKDDMQELFQLIFGCKFAKYIARLEAFFRIGDIDTAEQKALQEVQDFFIAKNLELPRNKHL